MVAAQAATAWRSEHALAALSEDDRLLLLQAKDALDKISASAVQILEVEAIGTASLHAFESKNSYTEGLPDGSAEHGDSQPKTSKGSFQKAKVVTTPSRREASAEDAPPPSWNPRSYKCNTPKGGREAIPWSEEDATYKSWQEKTLKKRKVGAEAVRAAMRFAKVGRSKDEGVFSSERNVCYREEGEHKEGQDQRGGEDEIIEDGSTDAEYKGLEGIYGALWAAYNGHLTRLRHFSDGITENECADESGRSALFYAAARGHLPCSRYLLAHKRFIIDVQDTNGDSPAHVSACYGHYAVLRVLLEAGANASATNIKGFTPLHMSARFGARPRCHAFGG